MATPGRSLGGPALWRCQDVIIVAADACEQCSEVFVNADTVVDPTAPDDVLELRNPIFVPPCPEE